MKTNTAASTMKVRKNNDNNDNDNNDNDNDNNNNDNDSDNNDNDNLPSSEVETLCSVSALPMLPLTICPGGGDLS